MNRYILDDIKKRSDEAKKYVKTSNNSDMKLKWTDSYKAVSYNIKMAEKIHNNNTDIRNGKISTSRGLALDPKINIAMYTALKGHGMSKTLSKVSGKSNTKYNNSIKNNTMIGDKQYYKPLSFNSVMKNAKHEPLKILGDISTDSADGSNLVPLYDNANNSSHHTNLSDNLILLGGIALCMMML